MKSNTMTGSAYCIEFFHAKPNCREELANVLLQLSEESKIEEGCLQYDILSDKENADLFILIVRFSSAETMLLHENKPYIKDFAENKMQALCAEVKWYDAFPITSAE